MPYECYKYARRADATAVNFNTPDLTNALRIGTATANTTKIYGQLATTKKLQILANQTDTYPNISLDGNSNLSLRTPNATAIVLANTTTNYLYFLYDGTDAIIEGVPANKNIYLKPAAGGYVKFGVKTAHADQAIDGYITFKLADGTTAYLATLTPV